MNSVKTLLSVYCKLYMSSEDKLEPVSNILRYDPTHKVIYFIMIRKLFSVFYLNGYIFENTYEKYKGNECFKYSIHVYI